MELLYNMLKIQYNFETVSLILIENLFHLNFIINNNWLI